MTDAQKLEAIKAEIERRKNETFLTASFNECKQFILNELQKFIASLDEQSDNCDTCTNDKGCVTCENGELYEGKPADYTKSNEEKAKGLIECGDWCESINKCDYKRSGVHCYAYGIAMKMAAWKDHQYKQEKKPLIEKACKWLDKMALSSSFINSFKKAMEEGEE